MPATPPFSADALTFLRQLRRNNRREWFQPRKAVFDEVLRRPLVALTAEVLDDLRSFTVDHVKPPERAAQRIYRDVRFSKDKSPYKTSVSALFPRAGLGKTSGAGYYFGISPDGVEIAAGMYNPGPPELAAVRADFDRDAGPFRKLIAAAAIKRAWGDMLGELLSRVPKAFPADHPAADLLRRKQFYFAVILDAAEATRAGLRKKIVDRFRAAAPFVDHLNGLVLAAERAAAGEGDARPARPKPMF